MEVSTIINFNLFPILRVLGGIFHFFPKFYAVSDLDLHCLAISHIFGLKYLFVIYQAQYSKVSNGCQNWVSPCLTLQIQPNLSYSNVDYPILLGYSKTTDSPDSFLYYLLQ